jgi:hypothetical protein
VLVCRYHIDLWKSLDVINEVKNFVCQSFDMKDLSEADVIIKDLGSLGCELGLIPRGLRDLDFFFLISYLESNSKLI